MGLKVKAEMTQCVAITRKGIIVAWLVVVQAYLGTLITANHCSNDSMKLINRLQ